MSPLRRAFLALGLVLLPSVAVACLWDYDTLQQERSRFPNVLELITGKFPRHSREFYEWRIKDRLEKLRHDPDNLAYLDDLAVAYDKTGQDQRAIDTMLAAEHKKPGRYETEANLGTFYIHAGQYEKGLEHIDKALRINPDAHFGRERYQRLVVEYLLTRRALSKIDFPLAAVDEPSGGRRFSKTFARFLEGKPAGKRLVGIEREEAIKGILGMMRFGHHDSPVLLEALGSLLADGKGQPEEDAKRLAARAYLKASYAVTDKTAQHDYREMAKDVLQFQTRHRWTTDQLPLEELEASFQKELDDARAWYDAVQRDERTWIREGKNPEAEFSRKYYREPQILAQEEEEPGTLGRVSFWISQVQWLEVLVIAAVVLVFLTAAVAFLRGFWQGLRGVPDRLPK
jgi:tetratricopeptide (TPR) repeat protein